MPSFDIVSEIDQHELANAIDQVNREVTARFDFKGSDTQVSLGDKMIKIDTGSEFQVKQVREIIYNKMTKRGIDIRSLKPEKVDERGKRAYQNINVAVGIDKDEARKLVKLIKESKIKAQAAIQGDQVRVTGKKRDDLQAIISMLKNSDIEIPLQFNNFRE